MGRVTHQIMGLASYRQNAGGNWVNEDYKFGNVNGKFSRLGCTPTSITNILYWAVQGAGIAAPTPSDTNNKNDTFYKAFRKASFKDLSYQGKQIKEEWFWRIRVDLFPLIGRNTDSAGRLLERIKSSIRNRKPVLIGIGPTDRHSIVGAGIDSNGNILVIDPWYGYGGNNSAHLAAFQTLQESMEGYDGFDMAYEVSRV